MAWFNFNCPAHGKFHLSLPTRQKYGKCPTCQTESPGIIGAGSTQIMERLDNGLMGRAIERLHNVEEILNDRSDANDIKQDGEDVE